MSRNPKPIGPAEGYLGREGGYTNDGPPMDVPALYRAGRAVPDRTQAPPIGPADGNTRAYLGLEGVADSLASETQPNRAGSIPRFNDELRQGVEMNTTRGNAETPKTAQEFGEERRARRGVRTRPPRPGQHP